MSIDHRRRMTNDIDKDDNDRTYGNDNDNDDNDDDNNNDDNNNNDSNNGNDNNNAQSRKRMIQVVQDVKGRHRLSSTLTNLNTNLNLDDVTIFKRSIRDETVSNWLSAATWQRLKPQTKQEPDTKKYFQHKIKSPIKFF